MSFYIKFKSLHAVCVIGRGNEIGYGCPSAIKYTKTSIMINGYGEWYDCSYSAVLSLGY